LFITQKEFHGSEGGVSWNMLIASASRAKAIQLRGKRKEQQVHFNKA